MSAGTSIVNKFKSGELLDVLIRFGLIAILFVLCDRVLGPFWNILIWALILAIALYPLHQIIARKFGDKQGRAATVLVLGIVLVLGTPTVGLGTSFVTGVFGAKDKIENQGLVIPAPDDSVREWPVVGDKVYTAWQAAATDTPAFIESLQPHLGQVARKILASAQSVIGVMFLFLASLIIAGIMMGYGYSGHAAMQRVFTRFTGDSGPELLALCVATVRSVALGVLGVAFIQALLLGIGFVFSGVPLPGLLALIVLLLGIVQVPAAVVSLPVIAWLWLGGDNTTTMNLIFTIYLFVAGLSDNVLKPLLLGRGVDAPMPVILLGALGGMFSAGIIGLFVGAVGLAVGYQLFMAWVNSGPQTSELEQKDVDGSANSG